MTRGNGRDDGQTGDRTLAKMIAVYVGIFFGLPIAAVLVFVLVTGNASHEGEICTTTDNADRAGIAGDIHTSTVCKTPRSLPPLPSGYLIGPDGEPHTMDEIERMPNPYPEP